MRLSPNYSGHWLYQRLSVVVPGFSARQFFSLIDIRTSGHSVGTRFLCFWTLSVENNSRREISSLSASFWEISFLFQHIFTCLILILYASTKCCFVTSFASNADAHDTTLWIVSFHLAFLVFFVVFALFLCVVCLFIVYIMSCFILIHPVLHLLFLVVCLSRCYKVYLLTY